MNFKNLFTDTVFSLVTLLAFSPAVYAVEAEKIVNSLSEGVHSSGITETLLSLIGESDKYWPWWLGAIFLGLITFFFWYFVRIPMAGSSSWQRIVGWREEIERNQIEKEIHNASQDDVMQAMMAETIAQFGEDSVANMPESKSGNASTMQAGQNDIPRRAPWQAHITFLLMMAVGGLVASLTTGDYELRMDMGSDFARLFGEGWHTWGLLLFGGVLIGFGTRMAGGCTIGHGLSGLSRFQVGSLIGTASFMGGAIIVSLIIESLLS